MAAADVLLGFQTLLLAGTTYFTWRTIRASSRARAEERREAQRREGERKLEAVSERAVDVYEAAEA